MTANELVTLLGRAWSRLLIYPGGLAFVVIWLLGRFQNRRTAEPQNQSVEHWEGSQLLALGSIVMPWLALALLPLPLAPVLPRQIDIVVALALLESPNLLAIRQELRDGDLRRLVGALNSYPSLILATLALAQAGNSLELTALARAPGSLAMAGAGLLHWLGAVALVLALPPALGIGPFAENRRTGEPRTAEPQTTDDRRRTMDGERSSPSPTPHSPSPIPIGLRLRALGLVALAALPWAGADGDIGAPVRMLGAAAVIGALLWGYDRLTRGQAARRWAWAYFGLDAVLLLALLAAAALALQARLA